MFRKPVNHSFQDGCTFSQLYPPSPSLTEANLPSQEGKVFIVTGASSGVGYHLASILYQAGGKVYITARSEEKGQQTISDITHSAQNNNKSTTPGSLQYLHLELSDLASINHTAQTFQAKEPHLHVLFNNAGVSLPPAGSKSAQNHELQLATNCLGPWLLTNLLLPQLRAATESSSRGSVRVVWTSSIMVELTAPKGGANIAALLSQAEAAKPDQEKLYTGSKIGNWFLASEFARTANDNSGDGENRGTIISVAQNPGNLKTHLLRHTSRLFRLSTGWLLYNAKMGAYTELWAGLSPELKVEDNGGYVIPWGRIHPSPRRDMLGALRGAKEGGTGEAGEFREWCDREIAEYIVSGYTHDCRHPDSPAQVPQYECDHGDKSFSSEHVSQQHPCRKWTRYHSEMPCLEIE